MAINMGKKLTAVTVARAKHSGKKPSDKFYAGSKQWVWQGTVRGKRREIGLGGYPIVSLREAWEEAFEFKKIAWSGGDPRETIRKMRVPTFQEAAEKCFDLQRSSWKSEAHAARGKIKGAYFHSDLFDLRREVMDDWAEFVVG